MKNAQFHKILISAIDNWLLPTQTASERIFSRLKLVTAGRESLADSNVQLFTLSAANVSKFVKLHPSFRPPPAPEDEDEDEDEDAADGASSSTSNGPASAAMTQTHFSCWSRPWTRASLRPVSAAWVLVLAVALEPRQLLRQCWPVTLGKLYPQQIHGLPSGRGAAGA